MTRATCWLLYWYWSWGASWPSLLSFTFFFKIRCDLKILSATTQQINLCIDLLCQYWIIMKHWQSPTNCQYTCSSYLLAESWRMIACFITLCTSQTVDKTATWLLLITSITLMMNNSLCCQSTNMPGYKSDGPEAGIPKQFNSLIHISHAWQTAFCILYGNTFTSGCEGQRSFKQHRSLRKEINQMWICVCVPTLTAAGEAHLNANILLLLKQMWWVGLVNATTAQIMT